MTTDNRHDSPTNTSRKYRLDPLPDTAYLSLLAGWHIALTQADLDRLAAGESPRLIRPEYLAFIGRDDPVE